MSGRFSSRGFSLIEVLVVIAIIGVLSAIVMASLSQARLRSRDSRRIADLKQIQIGLELHYDEFGQYPDGIDGATGTNYDGTSRAEMALYELKAKGYLPSVPRDPINDATYNYKYAGIMYTVGGKCKSYHLAAVLEGPVGDEGSLKDDADVDDSVGPQLVCGYGVAPSGSDPKGKSINCTSSGGSLATDRCYDLKP